jgi:hypothetical protein
MHPSFSMCLLSVITMIAEVGIGLKLSNPLLWPVRWLLLALGAQELLKINVALWGTTEIYFYVYWATKMLTVTWIAYISGWACSLAIPRVKAPTFYLPPVFIGGMALASIPISYPGIWRWYVISQLMCLCTVLIGCIFSVGREYRGFVLALGTLFLIAAGIAGSWAVFGNRSLIAPLAWIFGLYILLRTSSGLSVTARTRLSSVADHPGSVWS